LEYGSVGDMGCGSRILYVSGCRFLLFKAGKLACLLAHKPRTPVSFGNKEVSLMVLSPAGFLCALCASAVPFTVRIPWPRPFVMIVSCFPIRVIR
jgi:hypothetical protein